MPLNTFRHRRGLVDRQVRFPRQEPPDHADRSALLGLAGGLGPDLCAALRHAGLVRAGAGRRPPHHLRAARHRAGHHLRHLSLRGARTDPADEGSGPRRGERRHPGRIGLDHLPPVTLPNIKWGLLYGVLLCNARAMGEFGAVSVVSGHIRGQTNTMPLHVELLYNEYDYVGAFSVASLLAMLALVTLVAQVPAGMALRATSSPPRGVTEEGRACSSSSSPSPSNSARFPALNGRLAAAPRAALSPCSGRRARARPRCCASWAGWNADSGRVRFDGEDFLALTPASGASALSSSTTPCSGT